MNFEIASCDNGSCYNENYIERLMELVDEQASHISKLNTLINGMCIDVSYMIYFMKSSGYQNMERHLPEYKIYLEAKELIKKIKSNPSVDLNLPLIEDAKK